MTHNGIDIDQFILLTIYPTAVFFLIGLFSRRFRLSEPIKYTAQAFGCIIFAIVYIVTVPNGGAQGLAVVLLLFGGILFLMARKHILHPSDGEENFLQNKNDHEANLASKNNNNTTTSSTNAGNPSSSVYSSAPSNETTKNQ
ncbi:MAG: hypothetical protein M3297_14130 [Thermoproteota archaeon]|nr:hypothetical protein [Thermoproteota archaeon]